MRCEAEGDGGKHCGDFAAKCAGIAKELFGVGFEEADLAGVGREAVAGADVGAAEQNDAHSYAVRGTDDLLGEEVWIVIGGAGWGAVEIVKLADGGDAGEGHLEKG